MYYFILMCLLAMDGNGDDLKKNESAQNDVNLSNIQAAVHQCKERRLTDADILGIVLRMEPVKFEINVKCAVACVFKEINLMTEEDLINEEDSNDIIALFELPLTKNQISEIVKFCAKKLVDNKERKEKLEESRRFLDLEDYKIDIDKKYEKVSFIENNDKISELNHTNLNEHKNSSEKKSTQNKRDSQRNDTDNNSPNTSTDNNSPNTSTDNNSPNTSTDNNSPNTSTENNYDENSQDNFYDSDPSQYELDKIQWRLACDQKVKNENFTECEQTELFLKCFNEKRYEWGYLWN